jgi:hypothetical protein
MNGNPTTPTAIEAPVAEGTIAENGADMAHAWIRPALGLADDAPYRFDFYAQEIEALRAQVGQPERDDAALLNLIESVREYYLGFLSHALPGGACWRARKPSVTAGILAVVRERVQASNR